jgi:SNF2 family DNA or RNA helicase
MNSAIPKNVSMYSFFARAALEKGAQLFTFNKIFDKTIYKETFTGRVSDSFRNVYFAVVNLSADLKSIESTKCTCQDGKDCQHAAALAMACSNSEEYKQLRLRSGKVTKQSGDTTNALRVYDDLLSIGKTFSQSPDFEGSIQIATSEGFPQSVTVLEEKEENGIPVAFNELAEISNVSTFDVSPFDVSAFRISPEISAKLSSFAHTVENSKNGSNLIFQTSQETKQPQRNKLIYILSNDGSLQVTACKVSILKNGSFGTMSKLSTGQISGHAGSVAYITDVDRKIAAFRHKITHASGYSYYGYDGLERVEPELLDAYFRRVVETGRAYFLSPAGPPLRLAETLKGKVSWYQNDGQLIPTLVATDGEREYKCVFWNNPWYLDKESGKFGRVEFKAPVSALKELVKTTKLAGEEAIAFNIMLAELGLSGLIEAAPTNETFEIKLEQPVPHMEIESRRIRHTSITGWQKQSTAPICYTRVAKVSKQYSDADGVLARDSSGKLIYSKHDTSAEVALAGRLEALGFEPIAAEDLGFKTDGCNYYSLSSVDKWLDFAEKQAEVLRTEGWQFDASTEEKLLPVALDDSNLTISVEEDESWWFSLALNIEIAGKQLSLLPILIKAIESLPACEKIDEAAIAHLNRDGKFHTFTPEGMLISLPFERVASMLVTLGEFLLNDRGDKMIVSALDVAKFFEDAKTEGIKWQGTERLMDLVARLRRLKNVPLVEAPRKFKTELRPYQLLGLSWLQCLASEQFGGILADDMGLGKTVQLLAHISLEKEKGRLRKPFLVICPTSVLPNWLAEAKKFAPHLKIHAHSGVDRASVVKKFDKSDLVISTYPLLIRDLSIQNHEWHGIALDEAQAVKNAATNVAQAASKLKAEQRFCMTGTPIENHLGELWSQFRFLLPGLLGTLAEFNTHVRKPIEKENNLEKKRALSRKIRPFISRRTKNEVAGDLPEKSKIIKVVELTGKQRDLYETVRLACTKEIREQISSKGFKSSQIMILDALLKLRQVCCDPRLVRLESAKKVPERAKLEILSEMVSDIVEEGRKALIFSQFTSMLDLVAQKLDEMGISYVQLRGDTKDRVTPVKEFQEGDVQIFLLSLKAGGSGLNLTAADTVIHYDPWWNPAVEEQATDRAHRIGQEKNVFVYKLIASGTIEERMLQLQEQKRILASGIFDEQRADVSTLAFSEEDLEVLLRPIDQIT